MSGKETSCSKSSTSKSTPNSSATVESNVTCATESQAANDVVLAPGISSGRMFGNTLEKQTVTRSLMLVIWRPAYGSGSKPDEAARRIAPGSLNAKCGSAPPYPHRCRQTGKIAGGAGFFP